MPPPESAVPIPPETVSAPDSWAGLRKFTSARIALGRAGGSWRTETLLDFRLAHARARDAVLKPFQWQALEEQLRRAQIETFPLATNAADRQRFLRRPDLGRGLSPASRQELEEKRVVWGNRDLAILVSDGLSALAAERQIAPVVSTLVPLLRKEGWSIFPVFILPFARVKLQDEVGAILEARQSLILLGERPGLGAPDSLGAYFTYEPGPNKTDADRNCVSNIRPEGLPPQEAAEKIVRLLQASARLRISGVGLKEGSGVVDAVQGHRQLTQP